MLEAIHDDGYDCDGFRHVGGDGDLSPRHFCLRGARDCGVDQISALLMCGHVSPGMGAMLRPMSSTPAARPTHSHGCESAWCRLPRALSSRSALAPASTCLTTIPPR